jgi:hypothetical protein
MRFNDSQLSRQVETSNGSAGGKQDIPQGGTLSNPPGMAFVAGVFGRGHQLDGSSGLMSVDHCSPVAGGGKLGRTGQAVSQSQIDPGFLDVSRCAYGAEQGDLLYG